MTDCDFNQAALHPAYPIKRLRARREHRHPEGVETRQEPPLDPLENEIGRELSSDFTTKQPPYGVR
jgi:hypothetical protein